MQSVPRTPGQQPPVKIYNAVYSSVQVRIPGVAISLHLMRVASRLGIRMHGTGHCCHAQACGLLRECNPNTQGCWCRQGKAHEDSRERNPSWETRNSARRLWQIPRDLVRARGTFLEIMVFLCADKFLGYLWSEGVTLLFSMA
jgi:hypothetical protein